MRALLKRFGDFVAWLLVLPTLLHLQLWYALRPSARDQTFQGHSQLLSLMPGLIGNYLRRAFYRRTLTRCAADCCISFGTTFATSEVTIDTGVYIGSHCNLGHVDLRQDVLLGTGVMITSGKRQHYFNRLDVPIRLQGGEMTRVTVGAGSWIGNGAIVMADVGDNAVVGAGSVVVQPIPTLAIATGNPASPVATREHRP